MAFLSKYYTNKNYVMGIKFMIQCRHILHERVSQIDFDEIDQLMGQRQKEIKKEKSQIGYALALIFIVLIICVLLWKNHSIYAVNLGIGVIIGLVLRYSRFCFAAAFRDPFITGNTKVFRGVILGLIVSTIGFGVIQSMAASSGSQTIPGAINPAGLNVMVGAFIFGIGMVLAGGCASGLLMRVGEGHTIHLVVGIGFVIGSFLGEKDTSILHRILSKGSKVIYFPDYLSLKAVVIIQVIILMIMYKLARCYEKSRTKNT